MWRHSHPLGLKLLCQWQKTVVCPQLRATDAQSIYNRCALHVMRFSCQNCNLHNANAIATVSRNSDNNCHRFKPNTSIGSASFITSTSLFKDRNKKPGGDEEMVSDHSGATEDKGKDLTSVFKALEVQPISDPDGINVGAELAGELNKTDLNSILQKFYNESQVKLVAAENGIVGRMFAQTFVSFKKFCTNSDALPVDLHVTISDILQGAGHVTDILPYFIKHARIMFPHLECMEDLQQISDLRKPANWYRDARGIERKIIYHVGPTNSGKTYHALQSYYSAKSGVYCAPLRLLANEVFRMSNEMGTACDLVTGEERKFASADSSASSHISCTVEMLNVLIPYEVAVIDEIQMMKDRARGWAWTRAFLGVCAREIHVCGEESAVDLVKALAEETGDEVEIFRYKRLTPITLLDDAVEDFRNVRPGDCIVCFSKNDIFHCKRQLERLGVETAVIYGTLPPGTKLAQSAKFNDPRDDCAVMLATDAIGMGINLNIKRIIFYSLIKPSMNELGEKEFDLLPVSMAKQIAGRAGRYNTTYSDGEVTTFSSHDLPKLKELLERETPEVHQAGLHPTSDQIEMFAYHLPKATFSNLIDIFVTLSQLDNDRFFMCNMDDFKFLADTIEHIPLPLMQKYTLCCSPIGQNKPFLTTMFLKFARQLSRQLPVSWEWLTRQIGWPFSVPRLMKDLVHLEAVFDVLDLYLWLSFRFMDMFPDADVVREMQQELDYVIQSGITNLSLLLKNTDTPADIDNTEYNSLNRETRRQLAEALGTGNDNKDSEAAKVVQKLVDDGFISRSTLIRIQKELMNNIKEEHKSKIVRRNAKLPRGRGKKS